MWHALGAYLRRLPVDAGARPKAILVISAHWEEADFTVQTKAQPGLLFDYYGFPPHTYELRYPAPGAPWLAQRVRDLAADAGITVREDAQRDFDHGVFIPLLLAFPDADIPVIQLSLKHGLDPAEHLALGAALAPLRDEGVLMIGSGMSFHSIPRLMGRGSGSGPASQAFDAWLRATITTGVDGLKDWARAPYAHDCHPREEHLLPLMVVAGAGRGDVASIPYDEDSLGETGIAISAIQFGGAAPA